ARRPTTESVRPWRLSPPAHPTFLRDYLVSLRALLTPRRLVHAESIPAFDRVGDVTRDRERRGRGRRWRVSDMQRTLGAREGEIRQQLPAAADRLCAHPRKGPLDVRSGERGHEPGGGGHERPRHERVAELVEPSPPVT